MQLFFIGHHLPLQLNGVRVKCFRVSQDFRQIMDHLLRGFAQRVVHFLHQKLKIEHQIRGQRLGGRLVLNAGEPLVDPIDGIEVVVRKGR